MYSPSKITIKIPWTHGHYPLVFTYGPVEIVDLHMKNHGNHGDLQKAIEHGPVEIVDLPMKNGEFW